MRHVLIPFTLVALALVVPVPSAAGSIDCENYKLIELGGQAYIAIDEVAGEKYLFSIWIYLESNGRPGLQRGGVTVLGDVDICQNSANPDCNMLASCFF